MKKHTSPPWSWRDRENGDGARICNKDGVYIADCYGENRKANAARITKCVNMHESLILSLKVAFEIIKENCAQTEQMKIISDTLEELQTYGKTKRR